MTDLSPIGTLVTLARVPGRVWRVVKVNDTTGRYFLIEVDVSRRHPYFEESWTTAERHELHPWKEGDR